MPVLTVLEITMITTHSAGMPLPNLLWIIQPMDAVMTVPTLF